MNAIAPPCGTAQLKRLTALAALVALTLALPAAVTAQTTVTSSGRDGPTACLDQTQVNAGNLIITALSTTSVTFTTPGITWNQYVGRLGDVTPPESVVVLAHVFNARTNARVGGQNSIGILNNSLGLSTVSAGSSSIAGLAAKTNYYAEFFVSATLSTPKQVFARRCFMTGGTYTMTVAPNTSGRSSGCFSISPLTQQDVRNCWCGRENTLPLFSSDQDNLDWLNMWNCI